MCRKSKVYAAIAALLCLGLGWSLGRKMRPQIEPEHLPIIDKQAANFALDPQLVAAVVLVESKGNPQAVSGKGAIGLMQLRPATARQLSKELDGEPIAEEQLYEPELNVRLGCYYLHLLMREFAGDLPLVLAAYNTGPQRVRDWRNKRPDLDSWDLVRENAGAQTRNYVWRVLNYYGNARDQGVGKALSQTSGGR